MIGTADLTNVAAFGARLYAASVTPFREDGAIDHDALAALVDHIFAQGLDGIYAGGSSAEAFLMTDAERVETYRTIADAAAGRGRLIAHVGSVSLRSAANMAEAAAGLGYHGVSSVTPFFHAFGFAGIKQFFTDLCNATELPMILYHIPARTHVHLTTEQMTELLSPDCMAGVKFTDSDYFGMERILAACPHRVVLNGYDETMLQGLVAGAHGGIGTTYNVQGARFCRLMEAVRTGDLDAARTIQTDINEMVALMVRYGVFQSTKFILGLQGIAAGMCRAPFDPLSEEGRSALRAYLNGEKASTG